MPFQRPTIQTIYARIKADMETKLTSGVKLTSFSVLDILARVFAGAMHLCYGGLVWLSKQLFPDTADIDYLIRIGLMYGLPRKAATYCKGSINITGNSGTLIPAGTLYASETGIQYRTIADANINGPDIEVEIEAIEAGEVGNYSGTTLTIEVPIDDIDDVAIIVNPLDNGENIEDMDVYRLRLLSYIAARPAGGREQDYINWALEVSGIDKAWVFPNYISAGTVGTVVATSDLQAVSAQAFSDCEANIDANGPLGVTKNVLNPVPKVAQITIGITPYTDTYRDRIKEQLVKLFESVSSPGGIILLSQIRSTITNTGVKDSNVSGITYDNVTSVSDIEASGFDLPYTADTEIYFYDIT